MYSSHPILKEPADDTVLWRYMDFEQLVAMLEWSELFFPRLSFLEDPYEGHPPRKVVELLIAADKTAAKSAALFRAPLSSVALFKGARTIICASCWHMNSNESAAMWKLYSRVGAGIGVQSTFRRFKAALAPAVQAVHGGLVNYVDYETHSPSELNVLEWAICKRHSFAHEREFRGLIVEHEVQTPATAGVSVRVDLGELLENVYVSPTAPVWVSNLVKLVLQRYGLPVSVKRSTILDGPSYYP